MSVTDRATVLGSVRLDIDPRPLAERWDDLELATLEWVDWFNHRPADSLPADREAVFGFGEFEEHHHLTAHDRAVIADFEAKQALTKEFPNLSGNDALILLNALTDSVRHHTAEEVRHHDFAQRISGQRNGEPERHSRNAATERAKVETLDSVLEVFRIERSLRLMHESGVIGEILNRGK